MNKRRRGSPDAEQDSFERETEYGNEYGNEYGTEYRTEYGNEHGNERGPDRGTATAKRGAQQHARRSGGGDQGGRDRGDDAGWEASADELFGEHTPSRRRSSLHKDEQLCEQVFQVLTYAMADLADEVLRGVIIESVQMGPDGGRLLVTVISDDGRPAAVDALLARLERSRGRLRSEIASGIHRKRTPELGFRVMTREEVER